MLLLALCIAKLVDVLFQESVFSEREREWNGQQAELSGQLERVRGELEESQSQCLLLREASDKVQWTRHTNTESSHAKLTTCVYCS